ncbi:MAG TPA: hypothetical protein DCZ93_00405 [Elusimicrobia bacterium]|nr:hypothetical protein [Elusimicrobiota bacterium]
MTTIKNTILAAALALAAASLSFAGPVAYKEAAAPWSSAQAVRLVPALTPEVIKAFEIEAGPAAAEISVKKESVAKLLKRFGPCGLKAEDLRTADKYLDKQFRAEVRYFAGQGCAAYKAALAGQTAAPQPQSLTALENISASGALATSEGAARFFDGSAAKGQPAVTLAASGSAARPAAAAVAAHAAAKPIYSNVPTLRNAEPADGKAVRPADIGKDGRVNSAVQYWKDLRKENWAAYRKGDLEGAEKAKALLKAAAGAGLGGLLVMSNLPNVEIAGARLRWDLKNGASAGAVAADTGKLVFQSGVFILALAPIPMLKVFRAAAAGEVWAVALVGAMVAGPVNRYVVHVVD